VGVDSNTWGKKGTFLLPLPITHMGEEMMEKIVADERWRITIPKKFRDNFRPHQEFIIEKSNSEILILRAVIEKKPTAVALERIKQIQLQGDPARSHIDAASVKDEYGARKT